VDIGIIISNFLSPPILFFFLGMSAVAVRSSLDIPQPVPKLLSLYLLFSIGFRGGVELHASGMTREIAVVMGAAMFMASVVPVYAFFILRTRLPAHDAAAVAATYGSISAVTFITAAAFLQQLNVPYNGYMVAAMALMESPAIVIGVLAYKLSASRSHRGADVEFSWSELLRDALFNGSVYMIVGSLVIGAITGEAGHKALKPLTDDVFKGVLCFFLLDMGLVAAKRLGDLRRAGLFLGAFSIVLPLVNALLGIGLAAVLGLSKGDALMFTVLCASASYIAVPAAMRIAIPEANPSLYVPMSLAITFPLNIVLGLPLYMSLIQIWWR
jgi:hypothetical protein